MKIKVSEATNIQLTGYSSQKWKEDCTDAEWLEEGLIFATEEEALSFKQGIVKGIKE